MLQALAVVYPRIDKHQNDTLEPQIIQKIQDIQQETHIAYSETRLTNDIDEPDNYRLRVPCEALSYEVTGISPEHDYFALDELRRFRLSERYQTTGIAVNNIPYHQMPDTDTPQKRRVEQSKILFFNDKQGEQGFLTESLLFGKQGNLGLVYETYTLALTDDLLNGILTDKFTTEIQTELSDALKSGYLSGTELASRFANEDSSEDTTGQYWIHSGIAGFSKEAADHFFLPEHYTDAFDQTTTLNYDPRDLYIQSSNDPVGNTVSVEKFDYRVLAPRELKDINDNVSEVIFDVLGLPTATAVKGKGEEADNLLGFTDPLPNSLLNPERETLINFFIEPKLDSETIADYQQRQQNEASQLLGNATTRHIYYFGETEETVDGSTVIHWGEHPASACGIIREKHVAQLGAGETSPLQLAFEYSNGGGNVLVTKVQAEPQQDGALLSWIANGKTILNNKGKPVKQYEPYFSEIEVAPGVFEPDHRYEEPTEVGVTPIIYYDAAGRVIRTESPDDSFSRVEFSRWHVTSHDQNNTVLEPANGWYQRMSTGTDAEQRAARIAAKHAQTPATTFLDSLGREVVSVSFNRIPEESAVLANVPLLDRPWLDEHYITFTKLDPEGKPLWIQDARGNLVMRYTVPSSPGSAPTIDYFPAYDIAGNLLYQHSMDAGDRWMINDATGQPFYAWDENENASGSLEKRVFHTTYDDLRRPQEQSLKIASDEWTVERFIYGEDQPNDKDKNLRGQVYQHYDSSGLMTNESFDFKGNLLAAKRQLTSVYKERVIHWPENPSSNAFTTEIFSQSTQYDALNRMKELVNWHLEDREPAIYTPQYNQRGVLLSETLTVQNRITEAIQKISYDAKGQRTFIEYGNNTKTSYEYDTQTFRLIKLETINTITTEKLQDLSYTYDPVGNITEITDAAIEPVFFRNQQVKPRSQYIYDALYRLIEAEGREQYSASGSTPQRPSLAPDVSFPVSVANDPNALRDYTQRYQYDSVGNIMKMRHSAEGGSWYRDYAYADDSNRLLSTWTGGDDTTAVNYQYDTHGSMLNLNNVPEAFQLHWDTQDMIHDVDLRGGGHAWYNYDTGKQRTQKRIERIGGSTEERFYLGGMELYRRRNAAGEIKEEIETFHLFADDQRVLIVEDVLKADSSELPEGVLFRYQYGNHLGSVALEMNEDGALITYEEYHPYGTMAYQARNKDIKAAKKRYRYTGMERDEETGLSYHSARYYLPWLGRWTNADPIGLVAGNNLFRYVRNNPLKLIDSTGTYENEFDEVTIVGGPIRRVKFALDVDEVEAVRGDRAGGVAGSPSAPENKQFLDTRTNRQTKKNFVSNAPRNLRSNVSIANSPQEAADRILTGRFSEVDELRDLSNDATENTTPGRRTNAGVRRRIRNNSAVRGVLRSRGVNPDTLTLENPAGVRQFPTQGPVNLSPVDADVDPQTGRVVDGPNTRAALARRQARPPSRGSASVRGRARQVPPVGAVLNVAGSTLANITRATVPGVVEAEIGLGVAALYANAAGYTAVGAALETGVVAVPIVGGSLVVGAVVGNVAEAGARELGASNDVAEGAGAIAAGLTGAGAGALIGSPTVIGTPVGAAIGFVAGVGGYYLSKLLDD